MTAPCGTLDLLDGARLLGKGRTTAYRNARKYGELAPGIPILPSHDRRLRVSAAAVDRYLEGQERVAS